MPKNLRYDNQGARCVSYEGPIPITDEKARTALRAGAFAICNTNKRGQIFVDDAHGKRGGPHYMNFTARRRYNIRRKTGIKTEVNRDDD